MTPREVIARAIYGSFCERELEKFDYLYDSFDYLTYPIRDNYLIQADAVLAALEGMEPTEAMYQAWLNAPVSSMDDDSHGRTDCGAEWRAMVGAMRDE